MQIQGQYAESGSAWYNSPAAEELKALKVGPGKLFSLTVTNFNAAARFVYIFDSLSATGNLIVPPIPLTASGTAGSLTSIFLPVAIPFLTGLFVASSSTGATYAAAASADLRMTALYK